MKEQALEHPMWLISSHNKLAADPKVLLSTVSLDSILVLLSLMYCMTCLNSFPFYSTQGWIDLFFDEFIPHLGYFIRLNEVGKEAISDLLEQ